MSAEQKREALVDCEQAGRSALSPLLEIAQSATITLEALESAAKEGELTVADRQGNTALHYVCRNRRAPPQMVGALLASSAAKLRRWPMDEVRGNTTALAGSADPRASARHSRWHMVWMSSLRSTTRKSWNARSH